MKRFDKPLPDDSPELRGMLFALRCTPEECNALSTLQRCGWSLQVKRLMSSQKPPEECDLVATLISPDKSP